MATFFTDLAMSIFTPGPTPTLLIATNVTFAALQLVLLLLLIATYSVHFIVLSFLSAGLWWSINWFAAEVKAAQLAEEDRAREQKLREQQDEDTETEVEIETVAGGLAGGEGVSNEVEVLEPTGGLKVRREGSGRMSEVSTEDEWERVSENENEKDK